MVAVIDPKKLATSTYGMLPSQTAEAKKVEQFAPQARFTELMRKPENYPSLLESELNGYAEGRGKMRNFLSFGLMPTAPQAIAEAGEAPEEATEKMMQGMKEIRPFSYYPSMAVGAALEPAAMVMSGAAGLASAGMETVGIPAAAAIGAAAGDLAHTGYNWIWGNDYPTQKGETPQAGVSEKDARLAAYAEQHPEYKAAQAAYDASLTQGRALTGEAATRPSAIAFSKLYTPDGKLAPGVTPEQEATTRAWAAYEAKGLAGQTRDGRRDASRFTPDVFENNPATAAAGGTLVGRASSATGAPSGAAGQGAPQYAPGAMADAMDQYEEEHPGNRGGTLTTSEYNKRKAQAEVDRVDGQYAALGAQLGFADPKLAVALGRKGQFTHGMVNAAILQQQVRSSEKLDAKTDIYRRKIAAVEAAYAAAEQLPDTDPRKEQIKSRAQATLDEIFNTINAPGSVVTIPSAPQTGN